MGARRSKMKGRTTICVLAAAVCLLDSLTRADVDDNDYAWDPNDRTGSKASTAADMEGTLEAPSNLWHACMYGCPEDSVMQQLGLSGTEDGADGSGKQTIFAILLVLGVCGVAAYFLKKRAGSIGGYDTL